MTTIALMQSADIDARLAKLARLEAAVAPFAAFLARLEQDGRTRGTPDGIAPCLNWQRVPGDKALVLGDVRALVEGGR